MEFMPGSRYRRLCVLDKTECGFYSCHALLQRTLFHGAQKHACQVAHTVGRPRIEFSSPNLIDGCSQKAETSVVFRKG
jgi:hypothetical protein